MRVTVVGHVGEVRGAAAEHFLSFSAPIEIPGATLTPGTYIFKTVAPLILEVMNEQRSTV